MNDAKLTHFENRLNNEIAEIEERIKALEVEKFILCRQLAKAQADRMNLPENTRKNGRNKLLAQNSILLALRNSKEAIHSRILYHEARRSNLDLKETTFRSYLHRMKNEGLIKPSRIYTKCWILPDITESPK